MIKTSYILQPYKGIKTRHTCPSCNKAKSFSLYVDKTTGEKIADHVGRCNREINCAYHYTPKMYFEKNAELFVNSSKKIYTRKSDKEIDMPQTISHISNSILVKSLGNYTENNFIKYLLRIFGSDLTHKLINLYFIGSSRYWNGATVFWQIDSFGKIRTGKIMLYNPHTGKRIKLSSNYITWAHSALHLKGFNLKQCFFGEHLLNISPNKPIAIVESEKTAIIASVYLSEFIWLATGSLSNLKLENFNLLVNREIYLFPDSNCFNRWKQKALEIERALKCKIFVSDFIETNASPIEKEKGYDIADYLVKN